MEEPTYIKNMRELRKQAHYTQEDVSEKLNIQRQTYSNYENEWRQPPLDIIIRLAELYHVSTDDLLLGSEPIPRGNPATCEHLSGAVQNLLKEFYSLSEEEQATVRNIIQNQTTSPVHLSIPRNGLNDKNKE